MSASVGSDSADDESQAFAITDQETGDYVAGVGGTGFTLLEIGIHGVGRAWNTKRVTVRRSAAATVVRYDGPGRLDAKADLGGYSAFSSRTPVDPHPARLRIEAQMTPDGLGTADVWLDDRHYRVVGAEPPHTADPLMDIVVHDLVRRDWSHLYEHTVRLPGMTRKVFARTFGRHGTISELTILGATAYRVENGVAYADAPAHVVATIKRRHLDLDGAVELVYRQGEWRFSTIARRVRGD